MKADTKYDEFIVSLIKMRWLLFYAIMLGVALSVLVLIFSQSKFQAEVKVLAAEQVTTGSAGAGSLGTLAGLAGINLTESASVKYEALEILQSATFLRSFIESNDLLKELFAESWDSTLDAWNPPFWTREPTINDGSKRFKKDILRIREDRRTGIITVSIKWRDGGRAAAWANLLVTRLNAEMRNRAIDDSDNSLKYLNDQVEKTNNTEMKQAIYGLIEVEVNKAMLAQVHDEYAFRIIDPAIVPNESDKVWPRPVLILVGGASLGIFMAFLLVAFSRLRSVLTRVEIYDV